MLSFISRQRRYEYRWLWGLALALCVSTGLSLCVGEIWIGPTRWLSAEGRLFVGELRLPRTLAVALAGAALAVTGAVMQALFANPLAEPGLLGVTNGAGLALVAGILLGHGETPDWMLGLFAIGGALVITALLLHFALRYASISRLLLCGVALGIVCSAAMTWAVYFSTAVDLRQLMYWMMGGFGGISWGQGWLMALLVPGIIWLTRCGDELNLLALGAATARQLGLPLWLWRNLLVAVTGWLVGIGVALAGAIGFIGLIIPHALRLCGLSDYRVLLPGSALAGATLLTLADIVARRAPGVGELPIGVVTSTLGAPLFIWLLLRGQK